MSDLTLHRAHHSLSFIVYNSTIPEPKLGYWVGSNLQFPCPMTITKQADTIINSAYSPELRIPVPWSKTRETTELDWEKVFSGPNVTRVTYQLNPQGTLCT